MIYFAAFILLFAIIQLGVSLINVVFSQPVGKGSVFVDEKISVLIPARNEENCISDLLNDLKRQNYSNIEVIVFNDQSTDRTGEIVKRFVDEDSRFYLVDSPGLPEGWLGKNFACHSLAGYSTGEYLLFIDADVRIKGDAILNTVATARRFKLGLLSVFPVQIMLTKGEKMTVPNMTYILLSLLPLIFVRKSWFSAHAAANGQYMLFNRQKYFDRLPHERFKANKVEDIEIARFFKRKKIKIACITGIRDIECRMYQGYNEAVNGFSRNVVNFFGNSIVMAILFWLITSLGFIAVLLFLPLWIFFIYILIIILTRVFISLACRQNIIQNLIYLVPQHLSLGMFIYKAIVNKSRKNFEWKGRRLH